jgi:hypothetical protein
MGIGFDAAFLYPVLDIWFDPIFDARPDAFAADDHRYFRSFSPGLEGGVHGGVAGADYDYFLHGIEMRFFIVMGHFWELFTGNIHQDRDIVEAGGEDDVCGGIGPVAADDFENPVCLADLLYGLLQVNIQVI